MLYARRPVDAFDWHAANALRGAGVEAGHLIHMPTHLDIQVGEYGSSMALNQAAVAADLRLHAQSPSRFTIYFGYVIHNMEFCAWAAMLAGCKAAALAAAEQIDTFLTDEVLRSHPIMPTFNELYLTTRLMVLVRFGLWAEVLATPFKSDAALYAAHTLFLHYARGVAFGATADVPSARAEERAFLALLAQTEPGHRRKHNVDIVQMGDVAAEVLAAELLYREGACEQAFGRLEAGVARSMQHERHRPPALPPSRRPQPHLPTRRPKRAQTQPVFLSALRPCPSSTHSNAFAHQVRCPALRRAARLVDLGAPDTRCVVDRGRPSRGCNEGVHAGPCPLPGQRMVAHRAQDLPPSSRRCPPPPSLLPPTPHAQHAAPLPRPIAWTPGCRPSTASGTLHTHCVPIVYLRASRCRPAARCCRPRAQGGTAAGRRADRRELRLRAAELAPAREMLRAVDVKARTPVRVRVGGRPSA